jgi:hypothetical protein
MRRLIMKGGTVAIIVMASGVAAGQKPSRPIAAVEITPLPSSQALLTPTALDHTAVADRLLSFDGNGDHRIARDELPERMQDLVSRGDKNQDGFLTRAEVITLVGTSSPARRVQRFTARGAASLAEIVADLKLVPVTHDRAMEIVNGHTMFRNLNDPAWRNLYDAMRAVLDDEDGENFVAAVARLRRTSRVTVGGIVGGVVGTSAPRPQ